MITTVRLMAVEEARHVAKKLTPEEIGTALGRLARRIDQWKETKAELLTEAERLAGLARGLVAELQGTAAGTGSAASATASGRSRRGGRPKGMKVSEATKAKLRAAWKRRKAAAAKTTKTTKGATAAVASASPARRNRGGRPKGMKLSDETRAKLRAAWKRRKATAKRTA